MWNHVIARCVAGLLLIGALPDTGFVEAADRVVIILDDSGSMNEAMPSTGMRKMEGAKRALLKVIQQIPDRTEVGVLLLNGARSNNHWVIPLGPLDKNSAAAKVKGIAANGGTPLGEAMRIAADELLQAREKSVYGTYRLIVVTDGEATDKQLLDQYLPDILSRGLVVDAIGVNMPNTHSLATRVHSYRRADDEVALSNAIVEILAENNDRDASASEADFELLKALDQLDASEIVKALATPNNRSVTGLASSNNTDAGPTSVPPITFTPPAVIPSNAPSSNDKPGFIGTVFGTFCTCMLPILIAVMVFITIASKGNRRR